MSEEVTEVLEFTHFFKHTTFDSKGGNSLEKRIEDRISVSVYVELVTVDI